MKTGVEDFKENEINRKPGSKETRAHRTSSIPDEVIGFFNLPNPSSRTMVLGSTQPLTEMGTRKLPGSKGRPARKSDNLTANCEPTV
jgi:hypothetical protein